MSFSVGEFYPSTPVRNSGSDHSSSGSPSGDSTDAELGLIFRSAMGSLSPRVSPQHGFRTYHRSPSPALGGSVKHSLVTPFLHEPDLANDCHKMTHEVMDQISTIRDQIKQGILRDKVEEFFEYLKNKTQELKAKVEDISEQFTALKPSDSLQDLRSKSPFLDLPFASPKNTKEKAVWVHERLKPDSLLNLSLISLTQHVENLSRILQAKKQGYPIPNRIKLPQGQEGLIAYLGLKDVPELKKRIGEGAWGIVRHFTIKEKSFAVKSEILPRRSLGPHGIYDNEFMRDQFVPMLLDHPNIIKIFGLKEGDPVLEYVERGSLDAVFTRKELSNTKLPDVTILRMMLGLSDGLAYMHERGFIHKDFKPENILLTDDNKPIIIDFGSTVPSAHPGGIAGTLVYSAPEMLREIYSSRYQSIRKLPDEEFTPAMDVWALGLVFYELLTGGSNFIKESKWICMKNIPLKKNNYFSYDFLKRAFEKRQQKNYSLGKKDCTKHLSREGRAPSFFVDQLLMIVADCLKIRSDDRPTAREVHERLSQISL